MSFSIPPPRSQCGGFGLGLDYVYTVYENVTTSMAARALMKQSK